MNAYHFFLLFFFLQDIVEFDKSFVIFEASSVIPISSPPQVLSTTLKIFVVIFLMSLNKYNDLFRNSIKVQSKILFYY